LHSSIHAIRKRGSCEMEKLPNNLFIIITEKVAAFKVQDLLNFGMTSKCHHDFANKKVAFRAT